MTTNKVLGAQSTKIRQLTMHYSVTTCFLIMPFNWNSAIHPSEDINSRIHLSDDEQFKMNNSSSVNKPRKNFESEGSAVFDRHKLHLFFAHVLQLRNFMSKHFQHVTYFEISPIFNILQVLWSVASMIVNSYLVYTTFLLESFGLHISSIWSYTFCRVFSSWSKYIWELKLHECSIKQWNKFHREHYIIQLLISTHYDHYYLLTINLLYAMFDRKSTYSLFGELLIGNSVDSGSLIIGNDESVMWVEQKSETAVLFPHFSIENLWRASQSIGRGICQVLRGLSNGMTGKINSTKYEKISI